MSSTTTYAVSDCSGNGFAAAFCFPKHKYLPSSSCYNWMSQYWYFYPDSGKRCSLKESQSLILFGLPLLWFDSINRVPPPPQTSGQHVALRGTRCECGASRTSLNCFNQSLGHGVRLSVCKTASRLLHT